jgi:hypothetical protein
MDVNRTAGYCLIFSAVAMFLLIFVHPAHGGGVAVIGPFALQDLVHGLALTVAPIGALGAVILTRHIGFGRPSAGLALAFYLLGSVALVAAATISGLVTSEAVSAAHAATGPDRLLFAKISKLSVWLNRGFANVHVAYFSLAMLLWDIGWQRHFAIRATGIAAALGLLAWQLSGSFEPDTHSMPLVVAIQGAWLIAAATSLLRQKSEVAGESI